MLIARLARLASRHALRARAALLVACCLVPALAHAVEPNVTEMVVRFRDAPDLVPAAAPTSAEYQVLGRALRTGIASATPTTDSGFRISLAPSIPFAAARDAVNRLRMEPSILYASIAATDAQRPAPSIVPKSNRPDPPLHRIIVRYRDEGAAADAAAGRALDRGRLDTIESVAGQPVAHERTMDWARAYLVRLFQPLPRDQVEAIAQAIAQQPDVLWAQPDYIDQILLTPNDSLYGNQWHYFEAVGGIGLPNAWNRTTGWSGIRVGVVDTGALFGHPDVGPRFLGGYDFVVAASVVNPNDGDNRDPDASDPGDWTVDNQCFFGWNATNSSWHGTHVAGTIGAVTNNSAGVAGVNWVSRIIPSRVLGMCGGFVSDIADGMVWVAGVPVAGLPTNPYPARVVNMSLGGRRFSPPFCDSAYQTGITTMTNAPYNANVIVAAGNSNEDASLHSPASCSGIITVAATGRTGQRASYSNFGTVVEIAAPGGSFADGQAGVLSTLNSGTTSPNLAGFNYVEYQGTSMATPHVAGVVSLVLSLKPSLTSGQVTALVQSTARVFPTGTGRDCTTMLCGAGIINADALLTNIMTTGGPGGGALTTTTATLTSSANPSNTGSPVTFTSNVTGTAPTGSVAFLDGENVIAGCSAVALSGVGNTRTAQCTTSALPVGTRSIRAVYGGNASNTPADSPTLSQNVNPGGPGPTTTSVASNVNPSALGASVTFTATVNGFQLTGTVQFRSNNVVISGCNAVALGGPAGNTRTAQCTTTSVSTGSNTIAAIYNGDALNQTSTGTMTQGVFGPSACAGFNDVSNASSFCVNVQWLVNRAITLGCGLVDYCASASVSRIAMAAFMNREGVALTPIDLDPAGEDSGVSLATPQIRCDTASANNGDFAVTGFPRKAKLRATANVYSPTGSFDATAEIVYSTNGGSSWTAVPNSASFLSVYGSRTPADDRTVVASGALDLVVGTSYRFAVRVTRTAGTGDAGLYCVTQARIVNRNSATPPL